ncbi:MAG TPA: ABC transporter transmembrane domain-containing protein, partial [Actinomycetota bacterium]|nr:ABC transporter transmembrane domain-containing protein [Actinomycetota bacterium]
MSSSIDAWRGIAEETDEVSSDASIRLRRRSRQLLWSLLTPHKRALFLSTLLIILHTGAQLSLPYLVGRGIDRAIKPLAGAHGDPSTLWTIAVVLLGAVFTASAADRWFLSLTGKLGQDVLFDLRTRLFAHLQKLGIAFYERFTSGRVVARMTSDIDAISELLQTGLTSLAWAALSVVGIMVILLRLSLALGIVTLLSFPLILLLTHWFRRHSEQSYRAVRNAVALVIVHFTESLRGVRAVHAYRREPRNQEIFEDLDAKYRDANIWSSWLAAILGPGVNYLGRLTTLAIVVYGGFLLAHGKLTFGVLASFILYVRMFFDPLQELSQFYNVFQSSAAALEKLSSVLEEVPTVPEKANAVATADIRGAIRFEGVSFGYTSESEVLHDVELDIPAGQTVALVGETGAGKSTIARVISRFYDPTAGRITLDGHDLRDIALDLMHSSVVAVTQESFLFSGTVSDNILFGRPSATREEV